MRTMSIKVDGFRASIIIKTSRGGDVYESRIKGVKTDCPYYILDGKRHDLTEREREMLRELMGG